MTDRMKVSDLKHLPLLGRDRSYLVTVPQGWGRANDAVRAFRIAKESGKRGTKLDAFIYNVPSSAFVDSSGIIRRHNTKSDESIEIGTFKYTYYKR